MLRDRIGVGAIQNETTWRLSFRDMAPAHAPARPKRYGGPVTLRTMP
jgi:hypothetical protein